MSAFPLPSRSRARDRLARMVDIVIAGAGLIFFIPLMLALGLAVVAESGRPVFFVQRRLGRGGRVFRMYKFRKFDDRRDDGCPLTRTRDPRLTRVGHFLAKTKLDELPQLFNILRGDMAVVGPRPESLAFADCFDGRARSVLAERPGIFGPSQVAFRNECLFYPVEDDPVRFYRETLFPAKAALDLAYYPHRTLLGDLRWLARGIIAVAGVAPGAAAARATGGREWGGPGSVVGDGAASQAGGEI